MGSPEILTAPTGSPLSENSPREKYHRDQQALMSVPREQALQYTKVLRVIQVDLVSHHPRSLMGTPAQHAPPTHHLFPIRRTPSIH
jgi:hypothetical protein